MTNPQSSGGAESVVHKPTRAELKKELSSLANSSKGEAVIRKLASRDPKEMPEILKSVVRGQRETLKTVLVEAAAPPAAPASEVPTAPPAPVPATEAAPATNTNKQLKKNSSEPPGQRSRSKSDTGQTRKVNDADLQGQQKPRRRSDPANGGKEKAADPTTKDVNAADVVPENPPKSVPEDATQKPAPVMQGDIKVSIVAIRGGKELFDSQVFETKNDLISLAGNVLGSEISQKLLNEPVIVGKIEEFIRTSGESPARIPATNFVVDGALRVILDTKVKDKKITMQEIKIEIENDMVTGNNRSAVAAGFGEPGGNGIAFAQYLNFVWFNPSERALEMVKLFHRLGGGNEAQALGSVVQGEGKSLVIKDGQFFQGVQKALNEAGVSTPGGLVDKANKTKRQDADTERKEEKDAQAVVGIGARGSFQASRVSLSTLLGQLSGNLDFLNVGCQQAFEDANPVQVTIADPSQGVESVTISYDQKAADPTNDKKVRAMFRIGMFLNEKNIADRNAEILKGLADEQTVNFMRVDNAIMVYRGEDGDGQDPLAYSLMKLGTSGPVAKGTITCKIPKGLLGRKKTATYQAKGDPGFPDIPEMVGWAGITKG